MAKAKKRSRAKAVQAAHIAVGAKVRVVSGEWGNSTGTVAGINSAGVLVRLDVARHLDPMTFAADNLVSGGPLDRF